VAYRSAVVVTSCRHIARGEHAGPMFFLRHFWFFELCYFLASFDCIILGQYPLWLLLHPIPIHQETLVVVEYAVKNGTRAQTQQLPTTKHQQQKHNNNVRK